MKVVIIGASSGLGNLIAREYIQRGDIVGLAARRTAPLQALAYKNNNVYYEQMDIRNVSASIETLQLLIRRMGGMERLVLCAGVGAMNGDLLPNIEQDTVMTNVVGWTAIVDYAFSYFTYHEAGHLVAISSIAGIRGLGPAPSYSASKAYQSHYIEALRQRTLSSNKNIRITDIRPGFIRTPLLNNPEKFFWVEQPEKAVQYIMRAIDTYRPLRTITPRWRLLVPLMRLVPTTLISKIIYR